VVVGYGMSRLVKGRVTVVLGLLVHKLSAKRLRPLSRMLRRLKMPMKSGSRARGKDARVTGSAGHCGAQDVGGWELGHVTGY